MCNVFGDRCLVMCNVFGHRCMVVCNIFVNRCLVVGNMFGQRCLVVCNVFVHRCLVVCNIFVNRCLVVCNLLSHRCLVLCIVFGHKSFGDRCLVACNVFDSTCLMLYYVVTDRTVGDGSAAQPTNALTTLCNAPSRHHRLESHLMSYDGGQSLYSSTVLTLFTQLCMEAQKNHPLYAISCQHLAWFNAYHILDQCRTKFSALYKKIIILLLLSASY